jgi:hypothetical protein
MSKAGESDHVPVRSIRKADVLDVVVLVAGDDVQGHAPELLM